MTNATSRLYLVRHGEAKPRDEDPDRGLTDAGRSDVARMAAWASAADIQVGEIRHSGKLRAQQTADIFAEHLGTKAEAASGLAPNDDVAEIAEAIAGEGRDIMLVGHLPHMSRLASLLVRGDADKPVVAFQMGGIVCLRTDDEGEWSVAWMVVPELLVQAKG